MYTALAYKGFFPKEWLATMNQDGTRLPSHVDQLRTPGIDMTAGSLGQGLSCACGVALAGKMNRKDYRTFCIIGDGESDEGQIWEAAMFAAHHKLDNLVAITDCNKMQIDGTTKEILDARAAGRQVAGVQLGSLRDRRPRLGPDPRRPATGDRRDRQAGHDYRPHRSRARATRPSRTASTAITSACPTGQPTTSSSPDWATPARCPTQLAEHN